MTLHIFDTVEALSQAAAVLIAAKVLEKPDCVLGLATGSTPVPTYEKLIEMNRAGAIDFSRVTTYNLDEYCRLPEEHEQSYHRFMKDHLFDHINICPENTHVPDGNAADPDAEGIAYDAAIAAAGGIDLQLLGIGRNGHIAFNEPCDRFIWHCHAVKLAESTIQANKRFFDSEDQVPRMALSLGIGSIMAARQVLLLATGEEKAEAVKALVTGDVTPMVPASILRHHPNTVILCDKAAASLL